MNSNQYMVKVKNILGKSKDITLFDKSKYILKDKEEKIIGEYSDKMKPAIFKLLKAGLEVSKILYENIPTELLPKTDSDNVKTASNENLNNTNENINTEIEKPKKKRGRPPKNKN